LPPSPAAREAVRSLVDRLDWSTPSRRRVQTQLNSTNAPLPIPLTLPLSPQLTQTPNIILPTRAGGKRSLSPTTALTGTQAL
jgi:hypothetical protein